MTTIEKPTFRVVGTSPVRPDGLDKVTGAARYASDIHLPGMLHAAFVRSPHAHARILGIDTSRALELPGVLAVVTAADFAITENKSIDFSELQGNARMLAENILAGEKALYQGHAVAAVAAVDVYTAQKAAALIDVRYEQLQPVLTVEDAMRDGAPLLHEDMTTRFRVERFAKGDDTGERSNVAGHWSLRRGDNAAGFAKADVVVEREFRMRAVHQGYIEPHASTATWGPDDRVTVWTSTQSPFAIRAATAAIIGLPEHRVKVVPMEIGGGFGGKLVPYADPVVAMLSRKTGRPVKHVMSRVEEFQGTGPTSGGTTREDWRDQGRQARSRGPVDGLRSGRVPRFAGGGRRGHLSRALQHRKLPGRRLRRGVQPPEGGCLPRTRPATGELRGRNRDRRTGGATPHRPT